LVNMNAIAPRSFMDLIVSTSMHASKIHAKTKVFALMKGMAINVNASQVSLERIVKKLKIVAW